MHLELLTSSGNNVASKSGQERRFLHARMPNCRFCSFTDKRRRPLSPSYDVPWSAHLHKGTSVEPTWPAFGNMDACTTSLRRLWSKTDHGTSGIAPKSLAR